jgi:hypothetical protein
MVAFAYLLLLLLLLLCGIVLLNVPCQEKIKLKNQLVLTLLENAS